MKASQLAFQMLIQTVFSGTELVQVAKRSARLAHEMALTDWLPAPTSVHGARMIGLRARFLRHFEDLLKLRILRSHLIAEPDVLCDSKHRVS
eukprot:487179-Prymnesium_polylepis.3